MNSDTPASVLRALQDDADLEGLSDLIELALDLGWTWSHATDELWMTLDARLWALTHNPWVVLQTVSHDTLRRCLANTDFRGRLDALAQMRRDQIGAPSWFQQSHPDSALTRVAYFSMEFMLSEALPIYSGGLGNVAGDQLKAASDLGVPVVGVGLLYQQGYFRQVIDAHGEQQALYPYNDPSQLPITPLRHDNGEWLRLEVALPAYTVWLRAWQVQAGRVRLFLLDSNDAANYPAHRGITSELYGGDAELRLQQELILGIGGWRLLEAIGAAPEVCHLNEGHAAFAVLERARSFMQATGHSFDVALAATRAGNVFTTHTAVAAGFDRFAPRLIERYLGDYAVNRLGLGKRELLALGRQNPDDDNEAFNMAYLACRGSHLVNGVSHLHADISRGIFQPLFARWPRAEVPINSVTNGVHMPSWDSAAADALWTETCGKDRWLFPCAGLEDQIRSIADERLWAMRQQARADLVEFARERLARELAASGAGAEMAEQVRHMLQPDVLTLGFARRFATYKRPNLLLRDPDRLLRLLRNTQRPVQLIIAGKAHPADVEGRALIRQWIDFIRRPEVRAHAVFLADYDMRVTEQLVQGVDVWLNTPRRPWEACGTSGMKTLVNGGINLSELDGWWAQAFSPELGWALGDGRMHDNDADTDAAEADALYALLETQVVPEFYQRDAQGIPRAWVARMRESMARLTPHFSTNRTVREYTEDYYLPAAAAYRRRCDDSAAVARAIADSQRHQGAWEALAFGDVRVQSGSDAHFFEVELRLGELAADSVHVELFANGRNGNPPSVQTMAYAGAGALGGDVHLFRAAVPATRAADDYTARVTPRLDTLRVPLEDARVRWQR